MATFTKQFLSGSTEGRPILITSTSGPGDIIHTPQDAPDIEEVWLYVANTLITPVTLTVDFGDSASNIVTDIPGQEGLVLIVPGVPIQNSANIIRAFASSASDLEVFGWVNRIQ